MGVIHFRGCLIEREWAIIGIVLFGCAYFSRDTFGIYLLDGVFEEGVPPFEEVEVLYSIYIYSDGTYIHVQDVSHTPT